MSDDGLCFFAPERPCSSLLEHPSSSLLGSGSLCSNHRRHRCSTAHAPATNEERRTALQAAAKEGNIELVQLLATGADVNASVRWGGQAIRVTFSGLAKPTHQFTNIHINFTIIKTIYNFCYK
jgi:hypothetical protein